MLIFLNIRLAVRFYWLISRGGCLLTDYVRDLVTEFMFFPGIISMEPVVPYQQHVILFGVDYMCLTRHSVGNIPHNCNCWSLLAEGVPFTVWNTDVKRIDRTVWGWWRRGVLWVCLSVWIWQLLATGKLGYKGSKHWDMETYWNERAFGKNSIWSLAFLERHTWDTLCSSQQPRAWGPRRKCRNEAGAAFPQLLPWICQAEARTVTTFCS